MLMLPPPLFAFDYLRDFSFDAVFAMLILAAIYAFRRFFLHFHYFSPFDFRRFHFRHALFHDIFSVSLFLSLMLRHCLDGLILLSITLTLFIFIAA